jgi:starch synthase
MLYVIKDAIFTYGNKEVWTGLIKRAMETDFTWGKSAVRYEEIYEKI